MEKNISSNSTNQNYIIKLDHYVDDPGKLIAIVIFVLIVAALVVVVCLLIWSKRFRSWISSCCHRGKDDARIELKQVSTIVHT